MVMAYAIQMTYEIFYGVQTPKIQILQWEHL